MGKNDQIEGQMSLFDFLKAPSAAVEAPSKSKKKEYIPECCTSCKYWLGECRKNEKANHDMCDAWTLNNVPQWWGFLEPQEAVQELFSTGRIIGNLLESQVKNIYINFKEANDRIDKLRNLKGLCGQAWMPGEKELEDKFKDQIHGVTGYASSYTCGLTIRQRNFEGEDLTFGKYIPWEEVDKALWELYGNEYTGDADKVIEAVLHGSGFAGGKKRIIDFFEIESELSKRAAYLKQEYGTGGWSTEWGIVDCGPSGLDFRYNEPQKMHEVRTSHLGWPMVAKEIEKLIQRGLYIADVRPVDKNTCMIVGVECKAHTNKGCSIPDKCGLLKEVVKENNICKHSEHTCNKEELWKVAEDIGENCPKSCCRACENENCGARCNGAPKTSRLEKMIEAQAKESKSCWDCINWIDNGCSINNDYARYHKYDNERASLPRCENRNRFYPKSMSLCENKEDCDDYPTHCKGECFWCHRNPNLSGDNCLNCRKYKIECFPEHAAVHGKCEKYKVVPDFYRVMRCQLCKYWSCNTEQPPAGWGIDGFCSLARNKTQSHSGCCYFEMEGEKNGDREIQTDRSELLHTAEEEIQC